MTSEASNPTQPSPMASRFEQPVPPNVLSTEREQPVPQNEGEPREEVAFGRKRPSSHAWNHFDRHIIAGKKKAICNYCKKQLSGDPKQGTSHLLAHIKTCTSKKIKAQPFLRTNVDDDGSVSVESYCFDQEVARKELASMIILHEYPLNMVEHKGFRRFVAALQPSFKVVTRNTIRSDVLKIYEREKSRTMKLFEKNKSRFAITTDMWTSSNQKKGFMAVTAHFVDASWVLQSRIIRFIYVPCPHTAEVLSNELVNCLMDWNLDSKISTLTLDNCSTNDAMINLVLNKIPRECFLLEGELLHMRCCAHILNLIVKDGLEVISGAIENIRDSVAYWVATPKRYEKFEETVRQLKLSVTKKLALDCKTRWNSTFFMLNVAIPYKDVFKRLKQRDTLYKCVPSDQEWERAAEICEKLKLFQETSELFSGTKYPTANLYFINICEIRLALREWICCGKPTIENMAAKMAEKFDKYWFEVHGILGVASILDPRYKLKLLEFYFPLLYGDDARKCEIERIRKYCYDLVVEYASKFKVRGEGEGEGDGEKDQISTVTFQTESSSSSRIARLNRFLASDRESENVRTELDHYFEEVVIPRKNDFDILSWWKNALRYPILQLIARDILAIPVSTVASESAFSTSGRLVSPHRSNLRPDTLEALMCAQNWLAVELNGFSSKGISQYSAFLEGADQEDEMETRADTSNRGVA